MFRKIWAPSAKWGAKLGFGGLRRTAWYTRSEVLLCQFTTKLGQDMSSRRFSKYIFHNFPFKVAPPQKKNTSKLNDSERYLTLTGLQLCRKILFTPRCSPRAESLSGPANFFCAIYVFRAIVVKFPQFRHIFPNA